MLMKLTFIGADHEVTGSCHFLEVGDTKVLIDCGMEQGNNPYQNAELPVSYSDIDYVFLTHAHIDHAGMLPWIYARGFKGADHNHLCDCRPVWHYASGQCPHSGDGGRVAQS